MQTDEKENVNYGTNFLHDINLFDTNLGQEIQIPTPKNHKRKLDKLIVPEHTCKKGKKQCIRCRNYFAPLQLRNRYCQQCTKTGVTCRDSFCQQRAPLYKYGCCLMHSMTRCVLNIVHPEHAVLNPHAAQPRVDAFNKQISELKGDEKMPGHTALFLYDMIEKYNYRRVQDLKVAVDLEIHYDDNSSIEVKNRAMPSMRIESYEEISSTERRLQLKCVEKHYLDTVLNLVGKRIVTAIEIKAVGILRRRHVYNVYHNILPLEKEIRVLNNQPYMSESTGSTAYLYKPVAQKGVKCKFEPEMPHLHLLDKLSGLVFEGSNATVTFARIEIGTDIRITLTADCVSIPHSVYAFMIDKETGKARLIV